MPSRGKSLCNPLLVLAEKHFQKQGGSNAAIPTSPPWALAGGPWRSHGHTRRTMSLMLAGHDSLRPELDAESAPSAPESASELLRLSRRPRGHGWSPPTCAASEEAERLSRQRCVRGLTRGGGGCTEPDFASTCPRTAADAPWLPSPGAGTRAGSAFAGAAAAAGAVAGAGDAAEGAGPGWPSPGAHAFAPAMG